MRELARYGVMAFVCSLVGCSAADDESLGTLEQPLSAAQCPPGTNVILGTNGPDTLRGTSGADCIVGGPGDDRIDGGNGNDFLFGGDGNDVLLGQNGNDLLDGGAGDDRIEGGNGNDEVRGGDGNDVILDDNGNDVIDAGAGDDQVDAGNGNDIVAGGPGNDVLLGRNGDDSMQGGPGNDVLLGHSGNDTLDGGEGDDLIVRGGGNDDVRGGSGTDDCVGRECERSEPAVSACSRDADCASGARCLPAGVCSPCLSDAECDDSNVCRQDSCQPVAGCRNVAVADGTACLDADVCNGSESCSAGSCRPGTPLSCSDGLFCTGQEACDSVSGCHAGTPPAVTPDGVACTIDRCSEELDAIEHVPNDAACSAGFFCGASGCENVDECATGAHDCNVNATCRDLTPGYYGDEEISYVIPPFECRCNAGYEGNGRNCATVCDPMTLISGVTRCVRSRLDTTVDYRKEALESPWEQSFTQPGEPEVNYCGPTAVLNFLDWYGLSSDYAQLGAEMRTNTWDTLAIFGVFAAAGHLVGCFDPICWAIMTANISGTVVKAGTLPGDMRGALDARAPEGYGACLSDQANLDTLYASLAAGNPVVFLESRGTDNLHWAVATGLYRAYPGAELMVRVANSDERSWTDFLSDNSLEQVGDNLRRAFLSTLFGLHPYTSIRWIPRDQMQGDRCP